MKNTRPSYARTSGALARQSDGESVYLIVSCSLLLHDDAMCVCVCVCVFIRMMFEHFDRLECKGRLSKCFLILVKLRQQNPDFAKTIENDKIREK